MGNDSGHCMQEPLVDNTGDPVRGSDGIHGEIAYFFINTISFYFNFIR